MSATGSIDADVNITINAEDNATIVVESAARKINRQWRELRLEQRAVQQSFELSNRRFTATAKLLQSTTSIIGRAQSAFNTYQLSQLRVQTATKNAADAQRDLNDAIVEFGVGSPEAIEAARRNTDTMKELERANNDAALAFVFIGTSIATAFGGIPRIIGNLKNLKFALKGVSPITKAPIATTAGAGLGGAASTIGRAAGRIAGRALPFGLGAILAAGNIPTAGGATESGGTVGGEKVSDPIDDFLFQNISKPLGEAGKAAVTTIINIFASTPQEIVTDIQNSLERITGFRGN
ncbi:MAG: hypothetical protein O6761_07805 [Thaumarchaeota archaeon]|nr:hypothetical protein [Nitrososphaerota archaeon]